MKKLAIVIITPIVLVLFAIAALVVLVDPNQFKPLIVEQTKRHTQLDLSIAGDISWQFFPSVGFSLGETTLANPEGFTSPYLLQVAEVGVAVSVTPLLSNELHISQVTLDGARIHLETKASGESNLDTLSGKQQKSSSDSGQASAPAEPGQPQADKEAWTLMLEGASIKDAFLEIKDDQAKLYTRLDAVNLNIDQFEFGTWTPVSFSFSGVNNEQTFALSGSASITAEPGFKDWQLKALDVSGSFAQPDLEVTSLSLGMDQFKFGAWSKVSFAVKGTASDMEFDTSGELQSQLIQSPFSLQLKEMLVSTSLSGQSLPQSPLTIALESDLQHQAEQNTLNLVLKRLSLNDTALDGEASVVLNDIPEVRFALHSPEINLDQWLGAPSEGSTDSASSPKQSGQGTASDTAATEPDLSALKTLDVAGTVAIDKFTLNHARMQNAFADIAIKDGVFNLRSLKAQLYDGSIDAKATLNGQQATARYDALAKIKGVKIGELLKDVTGNDVFEGTGDIVVDVSGRSLIPDELKKHLAGDINLKLEDGAFYGVNIAQVIRTNYAKFKGETLPAEPEVKKTDFSAMTASVKLNKGKATLSDVSAQSPLLRLFATGEVNYLQETLDVVAQTSVVGSLEGQGGGSIHELKDLTLPVRATGSWANPKVSLDLAALKQQEFERHKKTLEEKARKEAERGLEKLLGDDSEDGEAKDLADSLLKKIF